jgi:integral membrane sensor domain MASE1
LAIQFGAKQIAIVAMSSAIYTVLGVFAASLLIIPGLPLFYAPEGFIVPATLWFGVWGALGAFFGSILFSPFYGYGYTVGTLFAIVDMIVPLVAGYSLRKLKIDISLKNKRSFVYFVLFGCLINVVLEALVGVYVSYSVGFYTLIFAYTYGLASWFVGSFTGTLVIGGILLRALSSYFIRSPLYHESLLPRKQEQLKT